MASNLLAMASNLLEMASNLLEMASNPIAMAYIQSSLCLVVELKGLDLLLVIFAQ